MLTDDQVLEIVKRHLEKQFPKTCACCGRLFPTLAEYVLVVRHKGDPMCLDASEDEWEPRDDEGTLSLANCPCGTTLAIGSSGIGILTTWRLLRWSRARSRQKGITVSQLLAELRARIDARVLEEHRASRVASTGR
jgi:hypothetical protein